MTTAPQIDELEAQIGDGLQALIAQTQRALSALQTKRIALDREIEAHARKLRAYESFRRSLEPDGAPHLRLVPPDALPTKPDAVLAFLSEDPEGEYKLVEIRRGLIERGFITDDKQSIHALEVAVINMEKRGDIRRVRKGIYTLRPRGIEDIQTGDGIGFQR